MATLAGRNGKMTDRLTWDEIKSRYPNEWVVLVDFEMEGDIPTLGVVADHGSIKKEVYARLHDIDREWFVRYTGRMRPGIVLGGLRVIDLDDQA